MLENCSTLPQCERKLSHESRNVDLLGEIPLSREDLDHLAGLIRREVSSDMGAGTRRLEQEAPTCLACFLVWVGILDYRDGDYWSAVGQRVNLPDSRYWQSKWGQIFLDVLRARGLLLLDIEGAHRYVSPILTHGGIPNSCLEEFFQKALWPLVRHGLNDLAHSEEILQELTLLREDNEARIEIEQQRDHSREHLRTLRKELERVRLTLGVYDEIMHLWELEESAEGGKRLIDLSEDYEALRGRKLELLSDLGSEIRDHERERAGYEQRMADFSEQDKRVLDAAEKFERAVSMYTTLLEDRQLAAKREAEEELMRQLSERWEHRFSQPWDDLYGDLLSRLPLDKLETRIKKLEAVIARQKQEQEALDHFKASFDADESWRRWQVFSFTAMILALIWGLVGLKAIMPWMFLTAGAGFTIISGIIIWVWYRRGSQKRDQLAVLEQSLEEATVERWEARWNVLEIVRDLPVFVHEVEAYASSPYRALASFRDIYQELRRVRRDQLQLQRELQQHAQHIEQIVATTGIQHRDSLADLIDTMGQAIEAARDHEATAMQAEKILADELRTKIAELRAKRQKTWQELAQVDARLAELGAGSVQAGIERVKTIRRLRDKAATLRTKLKERYSNLEAIESQIRTHRENGGDKATLTEEAERLTAQLTKVQGQINALEQKLSYCPAPFPGIDEPIRRYLLYGGESAGEFLVRSVVLVHQALANGEVPAPADVNLPERVVEQFERWWNERIPDESPGIDQLDEVHATTGQRFRAPVIFLEPGTAEVKVRFYPQRYSGSHAGMSPSLEVAGSTLDSQSRVFALRAYYSTADLIETREHEFVLPGPDDRYGFALKSDGNLIHRWDVTVMRPGAPYMVFDPPSGRLIQREELPRRIVWFLIHKDFSLDPTYCILVEGESLYGRWKDYVLREVDLEWVDELAIVGSQGQRFSVPIAQEKPPSLRPVGNHPVTGIHSEAVEVYIGQPPRIRVPISSTAELRLWRISILPAAESSLDGPRHYRVSEIYEALDVQESAGWIDALLTHERLLGQQPVGTFKIRLRKPPYTDWDTTFCVIPSLDVTFDKDVYLPHGAGETSSIRVEVSIDDGTRFVPQLPAQVAEVGSNRYVIEIGAAEDILSGALHHRAPDGAELRIPITINIPKVRWRLQGLEGDQYTKLHDTIDELWLGDWETTSELYLVVEIPFAADRLLLSLGEDAAKVQERPIRAGKARFNLLEFMDALRAGPSVQTFRLTVRELQQAIKDVPLFKVRTRWEVKDAEVVQELQDTDRVIILNATWTEYGRTDGKDRVVRLWSAVDASAEPTKQERIPVGQTEITLRAGARELPPGKYLLEFALEDPWSATVVSRPSEDAQNTRAIFISPIRTLREGEAFRIDGVFDDDGRFRNLGERTYTVRITGKIINRALPSGIDAEQVMITSANEGWYVGDLEGAENPELEAEAARANPVKIEIRREHREYAWAIENRDGEGAMFCATCGRLYWSQEMNRREEQKQHHFWTSGPIERFKITWV